jgi:hypothetical protein
VVFCAIDGVSGDRVPPKATKLPESRHILTMEQHPTIWLVKNNGFAKKAEMILWLSNANLVIAIISHSDQKT